MQTNSVNDKNNEVCCRLNCNSVYRNDNNSNSDSENNLIAIALPPPLSTSIGSTSHQQKQQDQQKQEQQKRNSPCRLFIPSAESQRICIICGFHEVDHYRHQQQSGGSVLCNNNCHRKPPLPPAGSTTPGNNNNHNNSAYYKGGGCPYDIRVEYLPRSSFQAKYGAKLPVLLNDDNYVQLRSSTSSSNRRHYRRAHQSLYCPTGGGDPFSDSELVGHQPSYSDSQCHYYSPPTNNNLNYSFSFSCSKDSTTPPDGEKRYLPEDMIKNPIMLSPSKTSAFEEYQASMEETKHHNGRKKHPPPPPPPPPAKYSEPLNNNCQRPSGRNSVTFLHTDSVISCDGGQEYFMDCDNDNDKDTDEEFEDLLIAQEESDLDETEWLPGDKKSREFDKMTQSNTEFNANPKNLSVNIQQNLNNEKAAKFIDKEMKKDLKLNISVQCHPKKNHHTNNINNNNSPSPGGVTTNGGCKIITPHNGVSRAQTLHQDSNVSPCIGGGTTIAKLVPPEELSSRDSTMENSSTIVTIKGPIGGVVGRPQSLNLNTKSYRIETVSPSSNGSTSTVQQTNNNSSNNRDFENSPSPSRDLSELSSNLSSSADISLSPDHHVTVTLRKPPLPGVNGSFPEQALPLYTGRKTGKFNKNIDDRLKKMAMDLETQRKSPKRPAPPPPPPLFVTTNNDAGNGAITPISTASTGVNSSNGSMSNHNKRAMLLNKSNSSAVVPSKRSSIDGSMFTVDINVCQHLPSKKAVGHYPNGRSVSQDRSLRSTPESNTDSLLGPAGPRGRSSKFASIRKFLKFEQKLQQNESSKFQSLRRFPSPFAKSRIDIGQIKGLFHGVEKCTAADEIAQDSDVVVTEITEVHSNINTLNRNETVHKEPSRPSEEKQLQPLLKPSYPVNDEQNRRRHPSPSNESMESVSMPVVVKEPEVKKSSSSYAVRRANRDSSPNIINVVQNGHQNLRRSVDFDFVDHQQQRKEVDFKKTIEENYDQMTMGHVVTLSHVSENYPDLAFRWKRKASAIINVDNLKWADFMIVSCSPIMITESAAFYPGVLKLEHELPEVNIPKVTIMVTPIKYSNPMAASYKKNRRPFFLPVIADFQEYVSSKLLRLTNLENDDDSGSESLTTTMNIVDNEQAMTLCKISILPRLMLTSLECYADQTANRHHPLKQPTLHEKDVCFVMIQFITALKYLQSQGIEDVASDFDGFFLIRSTATNVPQLVLCWETFLLSSNALTSSSSSDVVTNNLSSSKTQRISLCQSALACLCLLLHTEVPTEELVREKRVPDFRILSTYTEGFQKVADVLNEEKSFSLTQSKSLLEHMYWVSNHSTLILQDTSMKFETEFSAKMWLEQERARQVCNILKLILKQFDELDIVEEYRIQFLLHTSAKQLFDASVTLDERREVILV